jgi:malonyl-CoA/methylmalonyl-CoA synthetase
MDDRTLHVPPHQGRNILPCHSLFQRLLRFAHHKPPRPAIRDAHTGQETTHIQLLTDVLALRERIWVGLSQAVQRALDQRQEVYIAVLAPGGHEYAVAMLAVLALGAAAVPMTVQLPPEEALYLATKSRAVAVLVSSDALRLGVGLEKLVKEQDPWTGFSCVPIAPSTWQTLFEPQEIIISTDVYLADNAPGVVIFTSGTTGPPKGAVMRRAYTFDGALAVADHYGITSSDVLLHLLPVHHATGIGIMFFPFLISGALMEFRPGSFDPAWTWERWRQGGSTFFSGVPTIYMRMMRYFQQSLASRPDAQEYVAGARSIRVCLCGTSALPKPIADFWTEIFGRKILLRYGASEIGAVFKVSLSDDNVPDGSVGTKFPGYDIRLATTGEGSDGSGNQGEVLLKGPEMFSKYIFDPVATAAAHDRDGYYKTGDIARREGDYYWILGRASVDIIKSGGYKISALDIEREIMALPYVSEVIVVGVPDDEFGQRVAGAVCLKGKGDMDNPLKELTLQKLRQDLRSRLAGYKIPTLLRVIEGELPKSATGKVQKKTLGPRFFPNDYREIAEVQCWDPQVESKLKAKL